MKRIVTVCAIYPENADTLFARARDLREVKQAMAGLARYDGLPDRVIEQGDRFDVSVTLFGYLRARNHNILIERMDPARRLIQSRQHNRILRLWDHRLCIDPHPEGAVWTDRIALDAGLWTGIAARLCHRVYRYHHSARHALRVDTAINLLP